MSAVCAAGLTIKANGQTLMWTCLQAQASSMCRSNFSLRSGARCGDARDDEHSMGFSVAVSCGLPRSPHSCFYQR